MQVENRTIDKMAKRQPHILFISSIAEDRRSISSYLSAQKFKITVGSRSQDVFHELGVNKIDAIVLDAASDGTGLEICRKLRENDALVPIILFTNGGDHIDRIIGLELGADDCIEKPVNERELVARIRARLRIIGRSQEQSADRYGFAGLVMDVRERRIIASNGSPIRLTSAEFDLLIVFVSRPGWKLSRTQLLDFTDRQVTDDSVRSIDVLVSRIRRKLFEATSSQLICTIRNGGYQFTSDVSLLDRAGAGT